MRNKLLWLSATICLMAMCARAQPPRVPLLERAVPVLKQMRVEKISPQAAWDSGLLQDDVLRFLVGDDKILDAPDLDAVATGTANDGWKPGAENLGFARLLLEQEPDALKTDSKLNLTARFRLALYLASKKDPRGEATLRELLQSLPSNDIKRARMTAAMLRSTGMTPQQAYEKKLLVEGVLLNLINADDLLDSGRGLWNPAQESRDFSLTLVQNLPQLLEPDSALQISGRVRVGLALLSSGDPRGGALLNKMIDDLPRENPDIQVVNAILYNLSGYYQGQGEPKKAIDTALKIREFTQDGETRSNIVLQAADAAYSMGDKERAQQLYDEVIGYGYGWATGHVYRTLASHLFADGKLEEGRGMLKRPVEGRNGDQFRVILLKELVDSYFSTGQWEEARRYAKAAADQYKALDNPIKDHGLEYFAQSAEQMPEQIKRWEKAPLVVQPEQITLRAKKGEVAHTHFSLESFRSIDAVVTCESPQIQIQRLQSPYGEYGESHAARFYVRIAPEATQENLDTVLIVKSAAFADFELRVPLQIRVVEDAKKAGEAN